MKAARLQLNLGDFGVIGVRKGITHVVADGGDICPRRGVLGPHLRCHLLREGLTGLGPCCLVSQRPRRWARSARMISLQLLRSLTRSTPASTALMATCPTAAEAAAMTRASTTTRFSRAGSLVSTWSLAVRGEGIMSAETPVRVEAKMEKRILKCVFKADFEFNLWRRNSFLSRLGDAGRITVKEWNLMKVNVTTDC